MKEICIIEQITGAGWDCDIVGFFERMESAMKILVNHLEDKECEFYIETKQDVIIITVTNRCYLQYRLSYKKFNMMDNL